MAKFLLYKVLIDYINSAALGKCLFLDSYVARLTAKSLVNVDVFTSTAINNLASYSSLLIYSKKIAVDFFVRRLAFLTVYEKLLSSYFDSIIIFYSAFMTAGFVNIPVKLTSKFLLTSFLKKYSTIGVSFVRDYGGNWFLRLPVSRYCVLSSILSSCFNISFNGLFYLRPTFKRLLVTSTGIFS
ncbi:hypothetical protein ACWNX2_00105 [Candidatus Vidania fulgoroideorum]